MNSNLYQKQKERNQRLIDAVIRKGELVCPGSIAIIGICGSFCTGDIHERSDLDLMIVANDDRAWLVAKCFVLDDIGFDLYCTTWESLESNAAYDSPHLSKLLDSKIVYCPKEADRERLEKLRQQARTVLDAPMTWEDFERAEKSYREAEQALAKLICVEDVEAARWQSCELLYNLEQAICFLNKRYFRRGVKHIFKEFSDMQYVPENYEGLVRKLVSAESVQQIQEIACALLKAVDSCFNIVKCRLPVKRKPAPKAEELCGTLEEMISNWRGKVRNAAEQGDAYAALMALGSLQAFFDDLAKAYQMPRYNAMAAFVPDDLHQTANNFDTVLQMYKAEYDKAGLSFCTYKSIEEFEKEYLSV